MTLLWSSATSKFNKFESMWPQQKRGWGQESLWDNKLGIGSLDVCHWFYFSLELSGEWYNVFSCLLVKYQQLETRGVNHHLAASWHWTVHQRSMEWNSRTSAVYGSRYILALLLYEVFSAEEELSDVIPVRCTRKFLKCCCLVPKRSEVSSPDKFCSCQGNRFAFLIAPESLGDRTIWNPPPLPP